jgi:adenosylcobyric acid synthase
VVPYLHDLGLDEEDGVAIEDRRSTWRVWKDHADGTSRERPLRIGVIALPHMSNFTDFDALAAEPSVALAFLDRAEELSSADLVILPGTKQTLSDLKWLHQRGLVPLLLDHHARGRCVAGICGGFQMLGIQIEDPQGIENGGLPCAREGLGLLRVRTVLQSEKITRPATGHIWRSVIFGQPSKECAFRGYEIHVGETVYAEEATPFAEVIRAGSSALVTDGAVSADLRVFGTYVHGIFDDDNFRHAFIDAARAASGLAPFAARAFVAAERESRLDRLAAHVRRSLDLEMIRNWIGIDRQKD